MKVKRYIGKDINEAIVKIKSELGRDAIILHTRKIKKPGISGFFKKPLIEVVAAIDSDEAIKANNKVALSKEPTIEKDRKITDNTTIDNQIDSIKNMLNTVLDKLNDTPSNHDSLTVLSKHEEILLNNNINKPVVDKILDIVSRQISISEKNEETIKNAIKIVIKEYLGKPFVIDHSINRQQVFFFVGPTGVGKTTTLAKLAAKFSILNKKSVALITADTYRIGAVEQLKTYSEILDVPLSVVYEPSEIKQAIENYSDKNYIFVDTAGRNHNNKELLTELENIISLVDEPNIFLLMSLTTGYQDILNIIKSYDFLKDYKILFTKMDETSCLGNILNIKMLTTKPLSYITTGQSVPDDIEIADINKIANSLVGE